MPMDVGEHKPHPSRPDHTHHRVQPSRELESAPPHAFVIHAPHTFQKDDQGLHRHYPAGVNPSDAAQDKEATPSSSRHHHITERGGEEPSHLGSNFVPTLTRVPSTQYPPLNATPLPHTQVLEYSSHSSQQDPAAATGHEVTQVTNSLHAPISSLTPLPNDVGEGCGGGVVSMTPPTPYKKDLNRRQM